MSVSLSKMNGLLIVLGNIFNIGRKSKVSMDVKKETQHNHIQITTEDEEKTIFTCPWGTFTYFVLPFGLCNAPTTFQQVVIGIFYDLVHDCMEIYMYDFTTYGDKFDEALANMEKTLIRCKE